MQRMRGLKAGLCAVLLSIGGGTVLTALAENTDAVADDGYLNSAESALRGGHPDLALSILEHNPQLPASDVLRAEHLSLVCRARLEDGDPAGARLDCQSAIDANPFRSRWRDYNNLGVAEFRLGHDAAARVALESAAVLAGRVYTPRKNLAIIDSAQQAGASRVKLGAALVIR